MARTPWAPGAPELAAAARVVEAVTRRGRSADAALGSRGTCVTERGVVDDVEFIALSTGELLAKAEECLRVADGLATGTDAAAMRQLARAYLRLAQHRLAEDGAAHPTGLLEAARRLQELEERD